MKKIKGNTTTTSSSVAYHVYDSTKGFTANEWSRIVAVFTTGQTWQFKDWEWKTPVDIFSKGGGIGDENNTKLII